MGRRSSAEVQALIVAAARELFVKQGYEQTSTREIARHAGVIQAAVFRHFGTKEALFEHVVLEPLSAFVDAFVDDWGRAGVGAGTALERTSAYVNGLLGLVRDNRVLFSMLANANTTEKFGRSGHTAHAILSRHLTDLENRSAQQATAEDRAVMDLGRAVRFTIALVMGAALFEDTLFPAGQAPSEVKMVADELAAYALRGAVLAPF